jgi:hypothetical protein
LAISNSICGGVGITAHPHFEFLGRPIEPTALNAQIACVWPWRPTARLKPSGFQGVAFSIEAARQDPDFPLLACGWR